MERDDEPRPDEVGEPAYGVQGSEPVRGLGGDRHGPVQHLELEQRGQTAAQEALLQAPLGGTEIDPGQRLLPRSGDQRCIVVGQRLGDPHSHRGRDRQAGQLGHGDPGRLAGLVQVAPRGTPHGAPAEQDG